MGSPVTMVEKTGSCTGVTDWRLLEVHFTKSEVLIFWSITSYWNVWISLNMLSKLHWKTSTEERTKLLKTAIIEND